MEDNDRILQFMKRFISILGTEYKIIKQVLGKFYILEYIPYTHRIPWTLHAIRVIWRRYRKVVYHWDFLEFLVMMKTTTPMRTSKVPGGVAEVRRNDSFSSVWLNAEKKMFWLAKNKIKSVVLISNRFDLQPRRKLYQESFMYFE